MAYVIDRPNIQLDTADLLSIKNHLTSVASGYPVDAGNVQLDKHDLSVLHASVVGSQVAVQTENLLLTSADVTALVSHVT
jgi:hypothetical protein